MYNKCAIIRLLIIYPGTDVANDKGHQTPQEA